MDCSPPCCSGSRDQATQSIGSMDRRNGVSSDSISNVNDKHPSLTLTELVSEDEKEINAGNGSSWNWATRNQNPRNAFQNHDLAPRFILLVASKVGGAILQEMEAAGLRLRVSLKETNGSSMISWTSSLPFGDHGGKKQQQQQQPDVGTTFDAQQLEEIFMAEQTIHGSTTTDGIISLPAIVSMEQFSR
ncbi:hypothetical protein Peur_058263 [Populus x canadensis]